MTFTKESCCDEIAINSKEAVNIKFTVRPVDCIDTLHSDYRNAYGQVEESKFKGLHVSLDI